MIRYPAKLINRAKKLAIEEHLSYKEIGRQLNVSDSTIGIWFREFPKSTTSAYSQNRRKVRAILKRSGSKILSKLEINPNLANIFCAIIYGCEGAKYPASNCIALTNSDPNLVLSFINLLRISHELDESKFRIILQIHTNQDYNDLSRYWSQLLNIPIDKFYKPTITVAREGKHRNNYLGTCTVKYYDYRLQLKLIGIYEEFMRKSSLLEESDSGLVQGLAKPRPARVS